MHIYIMRHGQAFTSGKTDALLSLTDSGKREVDVMAKWIADQNISFDHVFVSPFSRAQETAVQLNDNLGDDILVTTLDFITPSGSAQRMHDYIDGVSDKATSIIIISHMPLVSYLVGELTFEGNVPIFQTAAIAHIDYDIKRMKGNFLSLISPIDL